VVSAAGEHEIAITSVVSSTPGVNLSAPIPVKDVVGEGYSATIYVTLENRGSSVEADVQAYVYWSNSTFANQTISTYTATELLIGESVVFNVTWNTDGFDYGNYTLSAYAVPIPTEGNITDNLCVGNEVRVVIAGDVTGPDMGVPQGQVEMRDIGYIAWHFGLTPTKPKSDGFRLNCDLNNDGVVNMRDIGIVCANFEKYETP
jgi:hypothetical protein